MAMPARVIEERDTFATLRIPRGNIVTANWQPLVNEPVNLRGFEPGSSVRLYEELLSIPDQTFAVAEDFCADFEIFLTNTTAEPVLIVSGDPAAEGAWLLKEHVTLDSQDIVTFSVPLVPVEEAASVDIKVKPIWEVFEEIMAQVPPELLENLPVDAALEHDHYLYGRPKRKNEDSLR